MKKTSLEKLDEDMADLLKIDKRDLNEGPTPQVILRYKFTISKILTERDKEQYFYVRGDDKFGFSELLVNQLMKFAYERGMDQGKAFGESAGYDKAMEEVKEKLNF